MPHTLQPNLSIKSIKIRCKKCNSFISVMKDLTKINNEIKAKSVNFFNLIVRENFYICNVNNCENRIISCNSKSFMEENINLEYEL